MTLGNKIHQSRKLRGLTCQALGEMVGHSASTVWKVENDQLKGDLDPDVVIRYSEALQDTSILTYALLNNPIAQRIIPRAFTPLNNINDDPIAILNSLKKEMKEAEGSIDILMDVFTRKDPKNAPGYRETLLLHLEQILDIPRNVEELFDKLKLRGAITEEDHLEVHVRQQAKCVANGHIKPDVDAVRAEG